MNNKEIPYEDFELEIDHKMREYRNDIYKVGFIVQKSLAVQDSEYRKKCEQWRLKNAENLKNKAVTQITPIYLQSDQSKVKTESGKYEQKIAQQFLKQRNEINKDKEGMKQKESIFALSAYYTVKVLYDFLNPGQISAINQQKDQIKKIVDEVDQKLTNQFKILQKLNLSRNCFRTDQTTGKILNFLIFKFNKEEYAQAFVNLMEQYEVNSCILRGVLLEQRS